MVELVGGVEKERTELIVFVAEVSQPYTTCKQGNRNTQGGFEIYLCDNTNAISLLMLSVILPGV